MTPIMQALASGYGEEEILKYISKMAPSLSKSISKAVHTGYSASSILGFLSKTMQDDEYDPYLSQEAGHKKVAKRRERITKDLLRSAASTGALYGAARAVPAALKGIAGAFQGNKPPPPPTSPPSPPSGIGPQPMGGAPVQPAQPHQTAPNAPQSPVTPQAAQPQAPSQTNAPAINSAKIINSMGVGSQIQNLAQAGNTPEAIATAVGVSLKPGQRKWLDEQIKAGTAKPLPDMVADFLSEPPQATSQNEQPESPSTIPSTEVEKPEENKKSILLNTDEWRAKAQEEKPIEKGDLVAAPGGFFGKIKDTRNGKSLVDIAGKVHQIATGDLISSPVSEKDLAELWEDLTHGIEKETGQEMSRNVNYAGYNPLTNNLLYIPHGGAAYVYEDISPEDAANLTNVLQRRKTSGENFVGTWLEGTESPIGHEMSNLIRRKQAESGGKGKEYSEKFETIYSALEPAHKAAKKKKAEKKKNERKR